MDNRCATDTIPLKEAATRAISTAAELAGLIRWLRGSRVMLDRDLARLYEVEVKALNQAVRRNAARFPVDFMFRLTSAEVGALRSQTVTLELATAADARQPELHRGRGRYAKYRPYAFTEQGVAMLSSVLRSKRAVLVNIEIMRTFVKLRGMLASNAELTRKLNVLEAKYDKQFKVVFDAIRELTLPPPSSKRRIGFAPWENES